MGYLVTKLLDIKNKLIKNKYQIIPFKELVNLVDKNVIFCSKSQFTNKGINLPLKIIKVERVNNSKVKVFYLHTLVANPCLNSICINRRDYNKYIWLVPKL